jgi:threonine/homoserine/homoserine lactone efflux protein
VIDPRTYALFVATAVVLVVTPGPDTILVVSRTLASGTRAGLWTLAGTQTGNVIHALLAGLGISTLVLLFPPAFLALKIAGAAYLVWLAVATWRADPRRALAGAPGAAGAGGAGPGPAGIGAWFVQGLTNNLVNAKMIPFFLALFPQFIRPAAGHVWLQSLVLGLTLAAVALVWVGALALATGRARARVAQSATVVRVLQRVAAVAFLGLAARLALSRR